MHIAYSDNWHSREISNKWKKLLRKLIPLPKKKDCLGTSKTGNALWLAKLSWVTMFNCSFAAYVVKTFKLRGRTQFPCEPFSLLEADLNFEMLFLQLVVCLSTGFSRCLLRSLTFIQTLIKEVCIFLFNHHLQSASWTY